jgi:hypothetical protein
MSEWKFLDPPNVAVIANRNAVKGDGWVAYASHDAEDGGWQFHPQSVDSPLESDAIVVSLRNVVERDSSIEELFDLPLGWCAWRSSAKSPWERSRLR